MSNRNQFTLADKEFLAFGAGNGRCGLNSATMFHPLNRVILGSEEHVFSESGLTEAHSLREKAVREDIATRLGKVCSNLSPDEFERLVTDMAARQVKCERRAMW